MEYYTDSLRWPLKVLNRLGLLADGTNRRSVIAASIVYMIMCLIIFASQFVQLINFKGNVAHFVSLLEGLATSTFMFGKLAFFLAKQRELLTLLKETALFVKIEQCPDKLKTRLRALLMNNQKLQVLFSISFTLTVVGFSIASLMRQELIVGAWPTQSHDKIFYAVLATLWVATFAEGQLLFAFDVMFLACCTEIVVQFKILQHNFRSLDVCKGITCADLTSTNNLRKHVRHHVFILKWTQLLSKFYSVGFMVAFLTLTPMVCVEMYAILESESVLDKLIRGQCFFSILCSLGILAIPVDYVVAEALAVGEAAYDSKWYHNSFARIHKPIGLIIQKSNYGVIFKAGGLLEVNSRVLLSILKVSWSTCTVMRGLKHH